MPITLNDQQVLLLAIGLGFVVGVMLGSWILTMLHKLLIGLVKLALLGVVVVIGIFVWNRYQEPQRPPQLPDGRYYQPAPATSPLYKTPYKQPAPPVKNPDRWWEK